MTKNQIQALRTAPHFQDGRTLKALAKKGFIARLRRSSTGWEYSLTRSGRQVRRFAYAAAPTINLILS